MTNLNPTILITTLNFNGLNIQIKRQRSSDWKRRKIQVYAVYRRHVKFKDTNRLKVKGCKYIYHVNDNQNRAGLAILIFEEIDLREDFKPRNIMKHKEGNYMMMAETIQKEDTIINVYIPNERASKYAKREK